MFTRYFLHLVSTSHIADGVVESFASTKSCVFLTSRSKLSFDMGWVSLKDAWAFKNKISDI